MAFAEIVGSEEQNVYGKKRILAIIPARAGSKRLPNKNLREFAGRPLIEWTLDASQASRFLDYVVVSSDCEKILEIASSFSKATAWRRSAHLATDDASVIDAVLDVLDRFQHHVDFIVLLQPTSPLRTGQDIDAVIAKCIDGAASSVISVSPLQKPLHFLYEADNEGRLKGKLRYTIPETSSVFQLNGALYICSVDNIRKNKTFISDHTSIYPMPAQQSWDIDDMVEFELAEFCKLHKFPA